MEDGSSTIEENLRTTVVIVLVEILDAETEGSRRITTIKITPTDGTTCRMAISRTTMEVDFVETKDVEVDNPFGGGKGNGNKGHKGE